MRGWRAGKAWRRTKRMEKDGEDGRRKEGEREWRRGKSIQSFRGCVFCVFSCAHVLTGAFVWEPDLALDLPSNLG